MPLRSRYPELKQSLPDLAERIYPVLIMAGRYSKLLRKKAQYKQKVFEEKDPLCKVRNTTFLADFAMERFITSRLVKICPNIPILSEENQKINLGHQNVGEIFFCLDPLDGSYCFANNNDNYSIQLALIVGGKPVLGFSHFPLINKTYIGGEGIPSHTIIGNVRNNLPVFPTNQDNDLTAFISNASSNEQEIKDFLKKLNVIQYRKARGSPNIASVLDEKCDIFPIFHTNFEWDVAAYDAVIQNAGTLGKFHLLSIDGQPIQYGKSQQENAFRNKEVIATVNPYLFKMIRERGSG